MKLNKENDKNNNVLEEVNALAERIRAMKGRFMQENSVLSNELLDIQSRLENLIKIQNQKEIELDVSTKLFTQYIDNAIVDIFKKENDVWLFDPFLPKIPPFVPISERSNKNRSKSTRFISLINFKGGVGKTTLTANLAAAFASGNYRIDSGGTRGPNLRVLIVDLDFQGTLSDRCVENRPLFNALQEGKTSETLLTLPKSSKYTLEDLSLDVARLDGVSIIPSSDTLDVKDNEHFIKLAFRRRDIRYGYRLWFHQPQVFDFYDLVIFDCPPRKTASSICALTASDFVFIPVAPDSFDLNSVTRTRNWLIHFKYNLNLPLKIGGIIFNRTMYQNKLAPSETAFAEKLSQTLLQEDYSSRNPEQKDSHFEENKASAIFKSFIPKRQGANSINGERGEVLPGALIKSKDFPFFTDVASEMYERISR